MSLRSVVQHASCGARWDGDPAARHGLYCDDTSSVAIHVDSPVMHFFGPCNADFEHAAMV